MFVTALASDGGVAWTRQYGGLDGISSGAGIGIDNSGSSVLDALGLPRGTINPNQTVDLTAQTTLRAGDTFKIQFQGTASRTATITIEKGETLQSLATKINIQMQTYGKASVNYTGGAAGLKIAVNPGVTLSLLSGPKDFDALARLGIPAGTLSSPSTKTTSSSSTATQAYGLGLSPKYDMSTKVGADVARGNLLGVLSAIQTAYQKTNTPRRRRQPGQDRRNRVALSADPALERAIGAEHVGVKRARLPKNPVIPGLVPGTHTHDCCSREYGWPPQGRP